MNLLDQSGRVDASNLRRVVGLSALTTTAIQSATAYVGIRAGRRDYADFVWGPGLGAIATVSALAGSGDARRRWGLAVVTTGWAARLAHLMYGRIASSDAEDPRYSEWLEDDGTAAVLAKVFGTQALAQLIVSAPIQLAAASTLSRGRRRWLAPAGIALMITGAVVEARADAEKDAYRALDKDEKPEVLDTGLWGWSRHPNYFGDSVVWDGVWVASAASPGAVWTLPAPAAMSYLLMYATGAKRTERRMAERPGYSDYQERVSFFFPWKKRG